MADVSWDAPLLPDQKPNPVVYAAYIELPDSVPVPTNEQLEKIFVTKGYKLQTWGRTKDADGKDIKTNDPHWIGVRNGTPLHTDRSYPRYSHHLKVRVDSGIVVRGKDKEELALRRGVFYILDTHSPHQVLHKDKKGIWNVAVSIDSDTVLEPADCISRSIIYAMSNDITKK